MHAFTWSTHPWAWCDDCGVQVMTRGKLMDRIKVALAGHIAVRVVLGQETNFSSPGEAPLSSVSLWPFGGVCAPCLRPSCVHVLW